MWKSAWPGSAAISVSGSVGGCEQRRGGFKYAGEARVSAVMKNSKSSLVWWERRELSTVQTAEVDADGSRSVIPQLKRGEVANGHRGCPFRESSSGKSQRASAIPSIRVASTGKGGR
jgi:hypothetical protein